MKSFAAKVFTLDTRSLALARIGLGAVGLYNLWDFLPSWELFFSPPYILPDPANSHLWRFSFHNPGASRVILFSLWGAHALLFLLLLIGFKTRWVTIGCWIMTVSLFNRSPELTFGGDEILRALLLWGMFLPLGERFSLDSQRRESGEVADSGIFSFATVALVIQLMMIYLINGFGKTEDIWTKDFTALNYIFRDNVAKPLAGELLKFPEILTGLTVLSLSLERFGAFLLLGPPVRIFRPLAVIIFVLFHLAIDLTMKVGWFSWIMIVYWTVLIPGEWWGRRSDSDLPRWDRGWVNFCVPFILAVVILLSTVRISGPRMAPGWRETWIYKIGQYFALEQNLLKFTPVNRVKHRYSVEPVFLEEVPDAVRVRYRMDRRPYYRTGKILGWIGPPDKRKIHYENLKKYMINYWADRFPDGPKVVDAHIVIERELIDIGHTGQRITRVDKY